MIILLDIYLRNEQKDRKTKYQSLASDTNWSKRRKNKKRTKLKILFHTFELAF